MSKLPKKTRSRPASFGMLGIPRGAAIEFLHDNVFLYGPGETFTVADQGLMVKCEYKGKGMVPPNPLFL